MTNACDPAQGGLSMAPSDRRGRVRLSLSPAEERRRIKALERKEQMLTEDIHIAGALLEMIDAGVLPRDAPLARKDPKGLQAWTGPMAWLAPKSPW